MTPAEVAAEMRRLSALLDQGVTALVKAGRDLADAEHVYRLARAKAWVEIGDEGTAKQREDTVNAVTAGERRVRDLAEAQRVGALEAQRSRRQQLSAAQTVAAAFKSDAELHRWGPQVTP